MKIKPILFLIVATALMLGAAYGASVNNFKIDKAYDDTFQSDYYSLHLNKDQDAGIAIYKNVDDDAYADTDADEAYDDMIHDDGREYITPDDDMKIDEKSDNTVEFEDYDHTNHGIAELTKSGDEEFIVVFWAKDTSDIKNSDLNSLLKDFNKDNDLKALAL